MSLAVEVHADASAATRRVASLIAERAREGAGRRGRFTLAVSRGPELIRLIAAEDIPWQQVVVYQVDERVAPPGHEDRNLTHLLAGVPHDSARPMPVDDPDPEDAATRYAGELPDRLDLVHLGLGPDAHTASLVPGDPVLDVRDRLVAITAEYRGYRRMTLTYPALEAAREIVWLVTGESKRDALALLLAGDASIPAARISNLHQLVIADERAAMFGV
ncbi:MAG: 6-phosphogluconolactonase [Gaiellaceae bacterium]